MRSSVNPSVLVGDDVAAAIDEGRGVVALETTIIAHGLPAPVNLEVARECEAAVRAAGATPATIGVLDGVIVVGLDEDGVARLADPSRDVRKLSSRDLGVALALGADGATTVAGTIAVAAHVGIKVMATGGLGGVHRGARDTFDESADLVALSRSSVVVVASGVKSILDVGATLERLDTLGVSVVGYGTRRFPGFYLRDGGYDLDWCVDNAAAAAEAFSHHSTWAASGLLLANPVAPDAELDRQLHDEALESALALVGLEGVRGKGVTPALLAEFARHTAGASVRTNRDLVIANARLAGEVAVALARLA